MLAQQHQQQQTQQHSSLSSSFQPPMVQESIVPTIRGKLTVVVESARGLDDKEMIGKMDPYALVKLYEKNVT
eukprot:TRINITY_DN6317_c0_g1_i1.p1 TRINITY_DN6317_c0_g1~~TRINITY_DN6317_c0_g1_i1.p1  ORF type:complete len:72 (+),score=13.58 TRINITY_DN6317_c0_g1_i1:541-756(+)